MLQLFRNPHNNAQDKQHRIHLVDRFLLIIMAILMLQSAYNLFASGAASPEGNGVDIVIRTSAAGIFGYFISANFRPKKHSAPVAPEQANAVGKNLNAPATDAHATQNKIGFGESETNMKTMLPKVTAQTTVPPGREEQLQIIVVASIGIAALLILIAFRNFEMTHASSIAILSQLRDFVSGCVGFLISCSTGSMASTK